MTDIDNILQSAFKEGESAELKPGFNKRVLFAIERKKKRAKRVFAAAVTLGACIILGVSVYLAFLYKAQFSAGAGYFQAIIGFGLILVVLQILDKKLVKDRMLGKLKNDRLE